MCATLIACIFSFLIYPHIMGSVHAPLDPDDYGSLGYGVWQNGTLSFYPDSDPTVTRGPIYPLIIAGLLSLTNGWFPWSIQLAQCILFGLTTLIVFFIARNIWNESLALYAQLACAMYPFLLWFTPRIWIEIVSTFLFSSLILSTFCLCRKPTLLRSIIVGLLIGVSTLCKQTFLPFIFVIPVLLFIVNRTIRVQNIALLCLVSILVVSPWTFRNWVLTKHFVPVHLLAGYNFQRGDTYCKYYRTSPFASEDLWALGTKEIDALTRNDLSGVEKEFNDDSVLLKKSLETYRNSPSFLLKKCIINSVYFWTLGETRWKTLLITCAHSIILLCFIFSIRSLIRLKRYHAEMVPFYLVIFYYLFHLPIYAIGRFSIVLMPTVIAYAIGIFYRSNGRLSKRPGSMA